MSSLTAEGGLDYDDILEFPGDVFQDKDSVQTSLVSEPVVKGGDTELIEVSSRNERQVLLFLPMSLWMVVSRP